MTTQDSSKKGRKSVIPTPEKLISLANRYAKDCEKKQKTLTYTGMIRSIGVSSRQALWKIEQRDDNWSEAVKYAKLLVEESYEEQLAGPGATGPIFALKNLGWDDKNQLDVTSSDNSLSGVTVTAETVNILAEKLTG